MKRLLKNTDFNIFPIIMGSDYFGGAISEQTAFENLDLYTEYGGNIIDTARLYVDGKSEEIIGRYKELMDSFEYSKYQALIDAPDYACEILLYE